MNSTRLTIAASALAAVALAGCGGTSSDSSSSTGSTPAAASGSSAAASSGAGSASTEAGSSTGAATSGTSASGSASSASSSGSGDTAAATSAAGSAGAPLPAGERTDLAKKISDANRTITSYHMAMQTVAGGQTSTTDADIDVPKKALAETITGGPVKMVIRLVGGNGYVQMVGQTPPGKFIKIGGDEIKKMTGLSPTDGFSASSQSAFLSSVKTIEDKGTETVDGEQLHRYRMMIDSSAVATQYQQMLKQLHQTLPPVLDFDVWIDGQSRMRRYVSTVAGTRSTTTISKIGEPVSIEIPPASAIVKA